MVNATKSSKAQQDSRTYTTDDLLDIVRNYNYEGKDRHTSLQIKAAAKKIERSLELFKEGRASTETTRKGLEGLKEFFELTGTNEQRQAVGATVNAFIENNYKNVPKSHEEAYENESTGSKSSGGKPSRLKRYIAMGALGFALLSGTPSKSFAEGPTQGTRYAQSINSQAAYKMAVYERAQDDYYNKYKKEVENNVESIVGKKLPQARTVSIIKIDIEHMSELHFAQQKQMKSLFDKLTIGWAQANPQVAIIARKQNSEIETYRIKQQDYYNKYQKTVESNVELIVGKKLSTSQTTSIIIKDVENIASLHFSQERQMDQYLDRLAKDRQNMAVQGSEYRQEQQQELARRQAQYQNVEAHKRNQSVAVKMMETQSVVSTGMGIIGEALWIKHSM
ncbi:MAG: hypothetical protein KGI06_03915 [Candidatus Micrarchaeota archaeon]|nr:hypothetical protein [Candidatus Micrarchaeota archaeon]